MTAGGAEGGRWTVLRILRWTTEYLAGRGIPSPRLDAEILLADLLGLSRVRLYLNFDQPLDPGELAGFRERVKRRAAHEPAAYILGKKEFYSLEFAVSPDVLIPRPETEHLVDEALALARRRWPEVDPLFIADLGTGSGAIAVTLAFHLKNARVLAVDVSPKALETAKLNAARHGVGERVRFFQGDLLAPLAGEPKIHLITANLPYVPRSGFDDMAPDVKRYEPHLALDGGEDGLDLIRRAIRGVPPMLTPDGALLLEIWPTHGEPVRRLAEDAGFRHVRIIRDHSSRDRIAVLDLAEQEV